jgi:hypothetical protein
MATVHANPLRICKPSWSWQPGPGSQSPMMLPTKTTGHTPIARRKAGKQPNGLAALRCCSKDLSLTYRR